MGARTILILLGLVAGLAAVLYFTAETPPSSTTASTSALDGRSLMQCKFFRWQFPEQPAFEIARGEDGVFRITEPITDRASVGYARQMVQAWDTANLYSTVFEDDAEGRKETGLDVPRMTFAAEWPDGHRVEYDLGEPGPLGTDRFLRRDGKIWSGGNGLFASMRVNDSDLRDRQVFLHQQVVCQELVVESAARTGKREMLHLQRDGGAWRMRKPYEGRAQPEAAIEFVTAVLSLRVDTFLSGLVRRPERDPEVVVNCTGAYGAEKLELWLENGAAFGPLPGREGWFQCDPRTYEAVFQNATDRLRARTLVGLADVATELAEIVIDPGQGRGERVHLLRNSVVNEWQLTEPVQHGTHPTRVNELVQAINNLRAVEFVDDKKHDDPELGLGVGRIALSVRGFDQRESMTLWLGSSVERAGMNLVHACRADEPTTVMRVPAPALERISRAWMDYCARDILRIPVAIGEIEVGRPGGTRSRLYKLDGEKGHWVEDGKPEARREVGEFARDDLPDLPADKVIDLRLNQLGDPDWIVRLSLRGGDLLHELRAWDRGADQPVVLQPVRSSDVGYEVGVRVSRQLRELWQ